MDVKTPIEDRREIVIEPRRTELHYWRDIWTYRELFLILAWRDVAVRYKQTVIGVLWAVIRPVLTTVVFTIIFGKLAGLPSVGNVPYPIMIFAGMLPWALFSSILNDASNSLVSNSSLVGKVYFPRLILPSATALVSVVDFLLSLAVLGGVMAWYGFVPDARILLLPVFVVMALMASLGPAFLISALNVKYRDFRFIIPFIIQIGLYISPVGFSSAIIPEQWRLLYSLNPMVGVIDGFRWCLLAGQNPINPYDFIVSVVVIAITFWAGLTFFRRTEKSFADLI
jgi:lipopolysaccharide transport system permease protein